MPSNQDIKSKFRLQFEEEGAAKVQKKVEKLNESLGKQAMSSGMSDLDRTTNRTMRQVAGLGRHLKDVTRTIKQMRRAFEEAARAASKLGDGQGQGGGDGDDSRGRSRRGSFQQGVLQGFGFGPYLQRGPGMGRQALGMGVGGLARGLGSVPFRGVGGLAAGLSSIPGGGLVGAALSTALGTGQSALQYQQSVLGLGGLDRQSLALRRRRSSMVSRADRGARERARELAAGERDVELAGMLDDPLTTRTSPSTVTEGGESVRRSMRLQTLESGQRGREESMALEARRAARREASSRFGTDPLSSFQRSTRDLSVLNRTQAMRFASGMGLSGMDRTFTEGVRGGGVRGALAGQTLGLGGPEVFGAFTRAQRRGGIVGAGERGAGIARTIEEAFAAGMDRTEVRDFLQTIARGQKQFEATGIPIDPSSIVGISRAVAPAFGPGARGRNVASGLMQAGQRVGEQGPRTPEEFLLLQTVGGFKGGGLKGLLESQERLETGEAFRGAGGRRKLLEFVQRISGAAGGGEAGQLAIRGGFQRLGVRTGIGEVRKLQEVAESGRVDEVPEITDFQSRLERRAKGVTGFAGGLRGARDVEDLRVNIGQRLLPAIQSFEKSTTRASGAFAELSPTLERVASFTGTVANQLPKIAAGIQNLVNALTGTVGTAAEPNTTGP